MIWKELPSNPNYLVSDTGLIKSKRFNKILTPKLNWDGYHRIQIWRNGKNKMVSWHRVVAETFVPNPDNKPVVNHIDGDKTNNIPSNLEWVTQQENIIHSWENGFSKVERNCPSTSTRVTQMLNGEVVAEYPSTMEAFRKTGIRRENISFCINNPYRDSGERRTAGGYNWVRSDETSND